MKLKKLSTTSLLRNGFIRMPKPAKNKPVLTSDGVYTILNNLSYYGFSLSLEVYEILKNLDRETALSWYKKLDEALAKITLDDKNMSNHVVYKNFPKEVLEKSELDYWIPQILMYMGVPSEHFTEEKEERLKLDEFTGNLKVIHLATPDIEKSVAKSLVEQKTSWSEDQFGFANELGLVYCFNLDDYNFKTNGVKLLALNFNVENNIEIKNATDVIRLAQQLSMLSFNESKFSGRYIRFSRPHRRYFLSLLEGTKNLEDDLVLNKKEWKLFLGLLHPHDYKFKRVSCAFDALCKGELKGFSHTYEKLLKNGDDKIFALLRSRAGYFSNKLHNLYRVFGFQAFEEFGGVIEKVEANRLLKLKCYFKNINTQKNSVIFPKSGRARPLIKNNVFNKKDIKDGVCVDFDGMNSIVTYKKRVTKAHLEYLLGVINQEISKRLLSVVGDKGINVDNKLKQVKLKDNLSENIGFGAGTTIDIPSNVKFIRTATFWTKENSSSFWVDNSLNFYDENFKSKGVNCWNREKNSFSVFSGDPVISKSKSSACQMIDVDIEKALEKNVRYIALSALSYNAVPLNSFSDALVTLQYCEEAQSGELYEPSRAKVKFDISHSSGLNCLVAVVDLLERKVIFVDKILSLSVKSAEDNRVYIGGYLKNALNDLLNKPSVYDLLEPIHSESSNSFALYSDSEMELSKDEKHYVFNRENKNNDVEFYFETDFI